MSAGTKSVDVAYSGVHQAFQLALAAQEEGVLRHFHCSVYDGEGKWGGRLSRLLGAGALHSRRVKGLQPDRVVEHPRPLLWKMVRDRLPGADVGNWLAANDAFDRIVAAQMAKSPPRAFIGTETCDLHCLELCRKEGVIRIHDCPQLHPDFLDHVMQEASERSGVRWLGTGERPEMQARKVREYELAEHLLLYSEVHRRSFEGAGFQPDRLVQCPLWVDQEFWQATQPRDGARSRPLRLLFVGAVNLRKGIPFLLEALRQLHRPCTLTLAGTISHEVSVPDEAGGCAITLTGPLSKAALRDAYSSHDVFILPSVADSFGFVALEAMSCGLPVILTENCGAPVPDPGWRVPAMNAGRLASRLAWYLDDPSRALEDGIKASGFAREFSPETYRRGIRELLRRVLA